MSSRGGGDGRFSGSEGGGSYPCRSKAAVSRRVPGLAVAVLLACFGCGGVSQSKECAEMLERMHDCTELDSTTRQLLLQMGYEEDGACWDDPEYAEACTQACIDRMADWDARGICP